MPRSSFYRRGNRPRGSVFSKIPQQGAVSLPSQSSSSMVWNKHRTSSAAMDFHLGRERETKSGGFPEAPVFEAVCVCVCVCRESDSVPGKLLTYLQCGLNSFQNCLCIAATVTFLKRKSGHARILLNYPRGNFCIPEQGRKLVFVLGLQPTSSLKTKLCDRHTGIPALPLTHCASLGKLLHLSSHFLPIKWG